MNLIKKQVHPVEDITKGVVDILDSLNTIVGLIYAFHDVPHEHSVDIGKRFNHIRGLIYSLQDIKDSIDTTSEEGMNLRIQCDMFTIVDRGDTSTVNCVLMGIDKMFHLRCAGGTLNIIPKDMVDNFYELNKDGIHNDDNHYNDRQNEIT